MTPSTGNRSGWLGELSPVALQLRARLRKLLHAHLGPDCRPRDILRSMQIKRAMAGRLHRAAHVENPLEIALIIPGPPTINQLLQEFGEQGAPAKLLEQLAQSHVSYLSKIAEAKLTQSELAALIAAHTSGDAARSILQKRAACFRADKDFAGLHADAISSAFFTWPNEKDPTFGDAIQMQAISGLRRYGLHSPMTISQASSASDVPEDSQTARVDQDLAQAKIQGTLVRELTSASVPAPRKRQVVDSTFWSIMGADLPIGEELHITSGVFHSKWTINIQAGQSGVEQLVTDGLIPARLRVLDYFVHKDMWNGIDPVLRLYPSTESIPEDGHFDDWAHVEQNHDFEIERLSAEAALVPVDAAPLQASIARYAFDKRNLDPSAFCVYRIKMRYPRLRIPAIIFFARR